MQKVAAYLEVPPEWLLYGDEDQAQPLAQKGGDVILQKIQSSDKTLLTIDVPVLGATAGRGAGGGFSFSRERVDYVRRPERARHMQRMYAFFVVTQNMYPRFGVGELVYVNPDIPAASGDDVILDIVDDTGKYIMSHLKRLKSFNYNEVIVEQFNPPEETCFEINKVKRMHRLMTMKDLLA